MRTATKEIHAIASEHNYRPPTQSQRLRSTLYRLWERSGTNVTFDDWYQDRMDRIISRLQRLLD
ncbi:MAG: hypothetical protein ABIO72_05845 [Patescibacteria group bacterium]